METKPCCHYCEDRQHVKKNGVSRAHIQRYLCTACHKTFQVSYIYHAREAQIHQAIDKLLAEEKSNFFIACKLGIKLSMVNQHILAIDED